MILNEDMKFVTFDVTNTLIKVAKRSIGLQYNAILNKSRFSGIQLNEKLANENFKLLYKLQDQLSPGYGFNSGMTSRQWWSIITTKLILNDKQIPLLSEADLQDMSDVLFDQFSNKEHWRVFDNCEQVLDNLKQQGYLLGVVSNFDERLFKLLDNFDLSKYFSFVQIPSNSFGFAKPSDEIFLHAVALAAKNGESNEFLHVGDSVELDYKASKRCGFKPILIRHNSDLTDLKPDDELIINKNYVTNFLELKDKILQTF